MITDYKPKSPGNLAQPAKGTVYADPVFGTKISRLTGPGDGNSASAYYSYWPVANCDSTRLIIAIDSVPHLFNFDPSSLKATKIRPLFDGDSMIPEGLTWSSVNPNLVFGISGYQSNIRLRAFDVVSQKFIFEHDFTASGELPKGLCWQMSKARSNDDAFSFGWRSDDGAAWKYAVVFNRTQNKTFKFDLQSVHGMQKFDECRLSRDGNFLLMVTGREFYIWGVGQPPEQRVVVEYNPQERAGGHYELSKDLIVHSDLWNGNGNRLIKRGLGLPKKWSEVFDSQIKDWSTSCHLSLIGPTDDWVLVSTETQPADYSKQFTNEVFLASLKNSGSVIRIAHHRCSNKDYLTTPFASLSPDGRFAFWNSDWGSGRLDVYCAVLPSGIWGASVPAPTPQPQPTPTPPAVMPPAPAPPPPQPTPTPTRPTRPPKRPTPRPVKFQRKTKR